MKVTQFCPTLWDPVDYTVHGILQAIILEWVAFPFSRRSSQDRHQTKVSSIAGVGVTREAQEHSSGYLFSSRSSCARSWTGVSCIAFGFFTNWAIREAQTWNCYWIKSRGPSNPGRDCLSPWGKGSFFFWVWVGWDQHNISFVQWPKNEAETNLPGQLFAQLKRDLIVMSKDKGRSASHSIMSDLRIPWTVACQVPLSLEFSRQEYWNRLPFPSPGNLPDPQVEPRPPTLRADTLPSEPQGQREERWG